MKPYKFKFMLWQLIAECDSGKHDDLSLDEVHRHAESGNISTFMMERFGDDADFSIFEPKDWAFIDETWSNIANAVAYGRKFGVESKGICLLMAYALQSLQMLENEASKAERV